MFLWRELRTPTAVAGSLLVISLLTIHSTRREDFLGICKFVASFSFALVTGCEALELMAEGLSGFPEPVFQGFRLKANSFLLEF